MKEYLLDVLSFISSIPVGVVLLIIFLAGMYAFWRGCIETGKDRSSIFDMYIISLIAGIIAGRVGYIVSNISEFTGYIWYWSPYEKYGDVIYIFRLLPWRFFRIWDGGIVIFAMFVGFLLACTCFAVFIKKWRWRQMYFVIFFSSLLILSLSFVFIASLEENLSLLLTAGILLFASIVFFVLSLIISRLGIKWRKRKKMIGYIGSGLICAISIYLSITFLPQDISFVEKTSIYLLDIWAVLSTLLFVIDMKRKRVNIEKISSVRGITLPEINQPIRLPVNGKKK